MVKTKTYRNGSPITLGNCNSCDVLYINGRKCHEIGCPDSWQDYAIECKECGISFYPEERYQDCCSPECSEIYHC
jgi:hypothetical protein